MKFLARLDHATSSAVRYLLTAQDPTGHWEDYRLPVGVSDAWVTAYVGLALVEAGLLIGCQDAHEAARRGAEWLATARAYPAGWGYNAHTGPDTDSTAFALLLLQSVGLTPQPADRQWLLGQRKLDGGFSTYEGPGAWGIAHPDVTPVAYLALSPTASQHLREGYFRFAASSRLADGTWPAYWWSSNHYSTYWNLRALHMLGEHEPPRRWSSDASNGSIFDKAFALQIAVSARASEHLIVSKASELLEQQLHDGSWPETLNLRVTDPDCYHPWIDPQGRLFADVHRLMTTSTAARALAVAHRFLASG
jgi:squalene cyclase